MYLAHGLPTSPNVRKATSRYQQESDNVQLWLDEHTEPDSGNHELRTPLYTAYKFWSDELGEKPLSAAEFYRYLEGAGYELKGLNGKRTVKGLRLTGGAVDSFSKLFGDVPLPR
jgi:phage/plasmid-associated DNA primase